MTDPRSDLQRIYADIIGKSDELPHLGVSNAPMGGTDMNIHSNDMSREPTRQEAEAALALLRRWAVDVSPEEVATLDPLVSRLIPGQEVSNYPALAPRRPRRVRSQIKIVMGEAAPEPNLDPMIAKSGRDSTPEPTAGDTQQATECEQSPGVGEAALDVGVSRWHLRATVTETAGIAGNGNTF